MNLIQKVLFDYKHHYTKLDDDAFTTIRSIAYTTTNHLHVKDMGIITINRIPFKAVQIMKWEDKRICDIPLSVLQKDMAYDGYVINSYQEFVSGLNELLLLSGFEYANNKITTKKRIYYQKTIQYL